MLTSESANDVEEINNQVHLLGRVLGQFECQAVFGLSQFLL